MTLGPIPLYIHWWYQTRSDLSEGLRRRKMRSDDRIGIRIAPELKAHLETVAERKGLALSAYVKMVLIESSGFRPKKRRPARKRRTRP